MSFSSEVKQELINNTSVHDTKAILLREQFISFGSITDPHKCYHLQFSLANVEDAQSIHNAISELSSGTIKAHILERSDDIIVYLKAVEEIIDLLTIMGATQAAMDMMQVKMVKDVRNYVNRTTNFETANLDKTVSASQAQILAIRKIKKKLGMSALPPSLREIAELRLKHPEMSLKALGELTSKPTSRSGVNHKLSRLIKIADELSCD